MGKYFLGFEWTDARTKVSVLKKDGKSWSVQAFDELEIKPDAAEESTKLLKEWVKENLPQGEPQAVLTLPESSIFLKELTLPKAKNEQLSQAIYWEISSVAPVPPQEAIVGWKKISEHEEKVTVSAMVLKNQVAKGFLSIFKKVGIKLIAIEPSSLAFSRIVKTNLAKNTLILIVEAEETNAVVIKNGVPVFSTSVNIPLRGARGKKTKLAPSVRDSLASNAKRLISFWEAREKDSIKQVIIAGEGSKYYGLARTINNFARVPVVLAKPKSISGLENKQPRLTTNRFLISLGAALRFFTPQLYEEVNLVPEEERLSLRQEKRLKDAETRLYLFSKINSAFVLILLLILASFKFYAANLSREIEKTQLFVQNHPAQEMTNEVVSTNLLIEEAGRLLASQKDTGERLRQIAQLTPTGIVFTSLEYSAEEAERWTVSGVGGRNDILAFYQKLRLEAGAKEVTMPYSNLSKEKANEFEIAVVW